MIYSLWILLSTWLVCTGWVLSWLKQFSASGYLLSLILFVFFILGLLRQGIFRGVGKPFHSWSKLTCRFRRPLPFVYLIYLLAALVGGYLYPPTNYDALCYRLPRILHWWSEGGWHWIGGWNIRMDYSATGFEWLAAPLLILFKTDRLLFLINAISYALLPGLVFMVLNGLGVSRKVAWSWMWILPTAYCFALQAGSIGNDMFATVYFLASAAFALRAVERSSWSDAALSILAAGLMTGAKASNLPLLLPLAFLMLGMARILTRQQGKSLVLVIVACGASFLPIAIMNIRHTGDWTGDPFNMEKMKLSNPLAGLVGNSLQLSVAALVPPVFPIAKSWNTATEQLFRKDPLLSLRDQYPRVELSVGELAIEEGAGLGLGLLILCCISLVFSIGYRFQGGWSRPAMIFGLFCWIALLAFMAKMGSEAAARLAAPYYAGIVIPLLALRSQGLMVAMGWWRLLAVACALSILPAVLLNPARPLLPIQSLMGFADEHHILPSLTSRARLVYSAYSGRNDHLAPVREHLPDGATLIGFAGTSDESEYSLWKPYGLRKIIDLNPINGNLPLLRGVDAIVGSKCGVNDRYHLTATELARTVQGSMIWEGKVAVMAGREPMLWYVIKPMNEQSF